MKTGYVSECNAGYLLDDNLETIFHVITIIFYTLFVMYIFYPFERKLMKY